MRRAVPCIIALLAGLILGAAARGTYTYRARCLAPIDGDTTRAYPASAVRPLRLRAVEAPERGDPGGDDATEALRDLTEGREVDVLDGKPDAYGRPVVHLHLDDGRCVNVELIRRGMARGSKRYRDRIHPLDFDRAEAEAREAKRGLWAKP